jgi:hypothetical protein
MVFLIVGWIALWRWRSWGLLGFYSAALALLQGFFGFQTNLAAPELAGMPWTVALLATAIDVGLFVGVFAIVGAIIVWRRGGKFEGKSPSEAEIDAELARIRAEAAARDGIQGQ